MKHFIHPEAKIHESAYADEPCYIDSGTKIWHFSHIKPDARLGKNCSLGQNVNIANDVQIGDNVKIQNNVSVYTGCTIEDDVFLGPSCVLTIVTNPRSQVNRRSIYEKTLIRRGATIGANATVVCGITLGRYCFVAAGSTVTKDVPDYALMVGNPARQKGWMSRHGHKLEDPDENGVMRCPESGLRYQLQQVSDGQASGRQSSDGQVYDDDPPAAETPGTDNQILQCLDVGENEPLPGELSAGTKSYRQFD